MTSQGRKTLAGTLISLLRMPDTVSWSVGVQETMTRPNGSAGSSVLEVSSAQSLACETRVFFPRQYTPYMPGCLEFPRSRELSGTKNHLSIAPTKPTDRRLLTDCAPVRAAQQAVEGRRPQLIATWTVQLSPVVKYHGLARRHVVTSRFLMRPLLNGGTLGGPAVTAARRISPRAVAFTIAAALIIVLSVATLLAGIAATFVSCSPGTDMGDANAFIRVGPPAVFGGAFGVALGRQVWRRRRGVGPPTPSRPLTFLRIVLGLATFATIAAAATWFLLGIPPWSVTSAVFYGPYYVSHVVPLLLFLRLFTEVSALAFVPNVTALMLARDGVARSWLIIVASLGAVAAATLGYLDVGTSDITPHGWALTLLDGALCLTLCLAAVDSFDSPRSVN
jgi:hypothetical protein